MNRPFIFCVHSSIKYFFFFFFLKRWCLQCKLQNIINTFANEELAFLPHFAEIQVTMCLVILSDWIKLSFEISCKTKAGHFQDSNQVFTKINVLVKRVVPRPAALVSTWKPESEAQGWGSEICDLISPPVILMHD